MMGSIIFLIILFVLYKVCKMMDINIDWIRRNKILSIIILIAIVLGVLAYLNRYSVLAFAVLCNAGKPLLYSFQKSLNMSNDITFFIGISEEILAERGLSIPSELYKSLQNSINESYGSMGTLQDLFELIKLVW